MTGGENGNNNPEESPKQRGQKEAEVPSVKKRLGEFLILFIYLLVEGYGVWPIDHFVCLISLVAGVPALLLLDGAFSWTAIATVTTFVGLVCARIYVTAPPILPDETDTHGWLVAGHQPIPAGMCVNAVNDPDWTPDSMIVSTGDSNHALAYHIHSLPEGQTITLLRLGNCDSVAITRKNDKLVLNAVGFDSIGNMVFAIENGEFHAVGAEISYLTRSPDRTSLTVHDKKGKSMLDVKFLNPQYIKFSGIFQCEGAAQAPITIGEFGIKNKFGGGVGGMCLSFEKPGGTSVMTFD